MPFGDHPNLGHPPFPGGTRLSFAVVSPPWNRHADTLFRLLVSAGKRPIWLSPFGFRIGRKGRLAHEDWPRNSLADLDAILFLALCGPRDPELLSWRAALMRWLPVDGPRLLPDPSRIEPAWNPATALLELMRSGIPGPRTYIGENIDEAEDTVGRWGGALFRACEAGPDSPRLPVEAGPKARELLEDLWQEHPAGPFVLQRPVDAPAVYAVVLGERVLAAFSVAATSSGSDKFLPVSLAATDVELAEKAASALGLSIASVEILRAPSGSLVSGITPFPPLADLLESRSDLGPALLERLDGMLRK